MHLRSFFFLPSFVDLFKSVERSKGFVIQLTFIRKINYNLYFLISAFCSQNMLVIFKRNSTKFKTTVHLIDISRSTTSLYIDSRLFPSTFDSIINGLKINVKRTNDWLIGMSLAYWLLQCRTLQNQLKTRLVILYSYSPLTLKNL